MNVCTTLHLNFILCDYFPLFCLNSDLCSVHIFIHIYEQNVYSVYTLSNLKISSLMLGSFFLKDQILHCSFSVKMYYIVSHADKTLANPSLTT